jgi:hypothetical protein
MLNTGQHPRVITSPDPVHLHLPSLWAQRASLWPVIVGWSHAWGAQGDGGGDDDLRTRTRVRIPSPGHAGCVLRGSMFCNTMQHPTLRQRQDWRGWT